MPIARTKEGYEIRYEVAGEGPPLLLVSGTGHDHTFWAGQVPLFSSRHRTIVFDNRGSGESAVSEPGYSLADMADDAAAVLDTLGIARCHVMGFSMGGHIAQELALRHPGRVASLGIHHSWARNDARLASFQRTRHRLAVLGEVEALADLSLLGIYDPIWFHDRLEEMAQKRAAAIAAMRRRTLRGWEGQLAACLEGDTHARLGQIRVPTFITASDRDMIVAPHRAEEIHAGVAGSRYTLLRGTGHVALIEQPEMFAGLCLDFLETVLEPQ